MAELFHWWSDDLAFGATGDLRLTDGTEAGQQRVCRRLLSPENELRFHSGYGAGLPAWVGRPQDVRKIESLIVAGMLLEEAVADDPPPVVTVTPINNGLFCRVRYVDAPSRQTKLLEFTVDR